MLKRCVNVVTKKEFLFNEVDLLGAQEFNEVMYTGVYLIFNPKRRVLCLTCEVKFSLEVHELRVV